MIYYSKVSGIEIKRKFLIPNGMVCAAKIHLYFKIQIVNDNLI